MSTTTSVTWEILSSINESQSTSKNIETLSSSEIAGIDGLAKKLNVNFQTGLTNDQVVAYHALFGDNSMPATKMKVKRPCQNLISYENLISCIYFPSFPLSPSSKHLELLYDSSRCSEWYHIVGSPRSGCCLVWVGLLARPHVWMDRRCGYFHCRFPRVEHFGIQWLFQRTSVSCIGGLVKPRWAYVGAS